MCRYIIIAMSIDAENTEIKLKKLNYFRPISVFSIKNENELDVFHWPKNV